MREDFELRKNEYSKNHIVILFFLIIITGCAKIYWSQHPLFLGPAAGRTTHSIVITRDLERRNFDIFNTEVYFKGDTVKYVQAFPAFKVIIGVFYKLFGEHEVFGRYVSIAAISVALYFMFHLLLYYLSAPWILFSLTLFSFNHITLYHTYMFQPTSFEIMLLILTLYLLHKYIEDPSKRISYIKWLVCVILLMLVKITYIVYLLPILYLFYMRYGIKFFLKRDFIIFSVLVLVICGSWYFYGMTVTTPAFRKTFISYFEDPFLWIKDNPKILLGYYLIAFKDTVFLLTIPGIVFTLIGLFFVVLKKKYHFLLFSFLSGSFMLIFIPHKFRVHPYNYINLLIWELAVLTLGILITFNNKIFSMDFRKKALPLLAAFFMISFIVNGYFNFKLYNDQNRAFLEILCKRVKENTPVEARIAFFGDSIRDMWTQECSYASDRKGWAIKLELLDGKKSMQFARNGATHIAVFPPETRHSYINQLPKKMVNLFAKFTLIDSIYNDYMLFSLYPYNNGEMLSKSGTRTSIQFGDEIRLEKFLTINEKNGFRIKYLWHSLKKRIDSNYILLGLNLNKNRLFDHRLFDKSFPTSKWHANKLYAEEVKSCESQTVSTNQNETEFFFVLYDPMKNNFLLPDPNDKGEIPVITASYTGGRSIFKCKWISEKIRALKVKDLNKNISQAAKDFLKKERSRYAFIREKYQLK
jgi:hypothetical protein